MNCCFLDNTELQIESLIEDYRQYLDQKGYTLKVEEYFMGINDTSYCALEKDVASYQVVLDSLATPAQIYDLDLEKIARIQVPAINLGPWGKELHKRGERVYQEDFLETIPTYLLELLYHFDDRLSTE